MKYIRKYPTSDKVGFHHVHMMRKANDPNDDFPGAVHIGPNSVAFVEEEIEAWMQRRADERPPKMVARADDCLTKQADSSSAEPPINTRRRAVVR